MRIGQKFGKLTAVKFMYCIGGKRYWKFKCDCGNFVTLYVKSVVNGNNLSCGCLQTQARMAIKGNEIENRTHYSIIHITHHNKPYKCLIDNDDLERIQKHTWYILSSRKKKKYAVTTVNGKNIFMHRMIMNCPDDKVVDHISIEDTLDNRKQNLRVCTQRENMQNFSRSKFEQTGVHFREDRNAWTATIGVDNKLIHLGQFQTYELAVEARKKAEKEYWK